MKPNPIQSELADCIELLKRDPHAFFRAYPQENTIIEYKAAFALDAALVQCPLVKSKNGKSVFNQAISYEIFQTLAAFANTWGGILIMGVSEEGAAIVQDREKRCCPVVKKNYDSREAPCFMRPGSSPELKIGRLQIIGLDREMALSGMDFDRFQRHLQDRFKVNGRKKEIEFAPAAYPCHHAADSKIPHARIKVSMSQGLDQHIEEIFPITLKDEFNNAYTMGAITVRPVESPIYLTIEKSGSQNLVYALPVRKIGKTELENDLKRIETYLFTRFKDDIANAIVKQLAQQVGGHHAAMAAMVHPGDLGALASDLATRWQSEGWFYDLVEQFGLPLRSYVDNIEYWQGENRPQVLALLLMVSLHYSTGWEKWTLINTGNLEAVKALVEVLHLKKWWRTRFRALYALQFMDQTQIAEALKCERHQSLGQETLAVVNTHVPEKTVVAFIKKIAGEGIQDISEKAGKVLVEIANVWKDPSAGINLPL